MGKIFYIMGKSASGKDHIYAQLVKNKELNLNKMVLYTTRPIREGEKNGIEYYFIDNKTKQSMQENKQIIEIRSYQTIHGIWDYFTADDGQVNLETGNYIGIGTLESYKKIREYYGDSFVCPIYIEVEDGERLERALKRERKQEVPKYEEMCRRYLADCKDFSEDKIKEQKIEIRFENTNLEECIHQIEKYVKSNI